MTNETPMFPANDYLPDIQDILRILWSHKKLIVLVFAACFVVGFALIAVQPHYYKASSTIVINDNELELKNFEDVTQGAKFNNLTIQTEIKMIGSPTLARQTIKKLDLTKEKEFSTLGENDLKLISLFLDQLSIAPQGNSRVIEISFKAKDPELAAKIVNTHVQTYFNSQVEFKQKRVEQLKGWFEDKVKDLKIDVIKKSKAVGEFRAKEDMAVGKDSQELVYQEISDISAQLVPVRVHKYDVQAKLEAIEIAKKAGMTDAIIDVTQSPVIQELKKQQSIISQEVYSLRSKYGKNHPTLKAAQHQMAQVEAGLKKEITNIENSLENDRATAEAQELLLSDRLTDLKKQADGLRIKNITLDGLIVEQEASQKLLDSFLTNFENIQSQVTFVRPDAAILSPAVPSISPAGPGKKLLLFLVMAFSGSLALAIVFSIEILRNGLRNFNDIQKLGQTPLGIIPKVDGPIQAMTSTANSSLREAVKQIYMAGLTNHAHRTILITSALPREGRTTLSILLSLYLSSLGHKVLVIDADYLKPSLGKITGANSGPGLCNVLTGQVPVKKAIYAHEDGFFILGAGTKENGKSQTLQPEDFHNLLEVLKKEYDYIVIDSGPILARTEATAIARHVDGIILVTEWIKTSKENMSNMLSLLKGFSTPVLGIVLNQVDIDKYKSSTLSSDFLLPNIVKAARTG